MDARPVIELRGEEKHILHATWSRSKKNMILTVARDERWNGYQQLLHRGWEPSTGHRPLRE